MYDENKPDNQNNVCGLALGASLGGGRPAGLKALPHHWARLRLCTNKRSSMKQLTKLTSLAVIQICLRNSWPSHVRSFRSSSHEFCCQADAH